jgi:metal-sulfur cluster biosynthetic enzyme
MAKVVKLKNVYNAASIEEHVIKECKDIPDPTIRVVGCEFDLVARIKKEGTDRHLTFEQASKHNSLSYYIKEAVNDAMALNNESEEDAMKIVANQFSPEYIIASTLSGKRGCFDWCMSEAAKEKSGVILIYDGSLLVPVDSEHNRHGGENQYYFKAKKDSSLKKALNKILWYELG